MKVGSNYESTYKKYVRNDEELDFAKAPTSKEIPNYVYPKSLKKFSLN